MWFIKALCLLVSSLSFAHAFDLLVEGPFNPGPIDTAAGRAAAAAAGRHPDATHDVTFHRVSNRTQETFNWRINITNLAIPRPDQDLGKPDADYSDGLYATNIQWQLEWPKREDGSSQSLQSFLADGNVTMWASVYITSLPSGIASRWTDPGDGDCTSILGERCTAKIGSATSGHEVGVAIGSLACKDALGAPETSREVASFTMYSNGERPIQTDDTFFFLTSSVFHKGNSTIYNSATTALQVMTLDFTPDSPNALGASGGPSVVCQIVDCKDCTNSSTPPLGLSVLGLGLIGLLVVLSLLWLWLQRKPLSRIRLQ